MMISAFVKAFAQLSDPRLLRVVLAGFLATTVIYAVLIAALIWALAQAWVQELPLVGAIAAWGTAVGAVIIATLLFPGIVAAFIGLWMDQIAAAVEARHHPDLPPPRDIPLHESVASSLRLAGLAVGVNLLLLPLYIVLIFLPPLNMVVYYAVNGRLLGQEYFESIAQRRRTADDARGLRRDHIGQVWLAGIAMTILLTIPVLNIVAPIIGAAAMVHLFQKINLEKLG